MTSRFYLACVSGLLACLIGCKARTSTVASNDEGGLAHNLEQRIAESLEFSMTTLSIGAVLDATAVSKDASAFGNEMAKHYDDCHEPPQCADQDLGDDINPTMFFAKKRSPLVDRASDRVCFPNSALRDSKTGQIGRRGFWITGETGIPLSQQQEARDRGEAVARNYFNGDSGVANAARHSFLFCFLAARHGYDTAKIVADNHERFFPEDGLEDTWADYWNNEQGMRFGAILHRTIFESTSAEVAKMRSAYLPYQKTQASNPLGSIPDIIDLRGFPSEGSGRFMAPDWVLARSCKRYLEGVIRGEVMITERPGAKATRVLMMTHRPSIRTRLDRQGFAPLLGAKSEVSLLAPMSPFMLPTANRGGLEWVNGSPRAPADSCIKDPKRSGIYWDGTPPTLAGAAGDYFKYWPHFDPRQDRHRVGEGH